MVNTSVKSAFKANRAEELGLDVWGDFVIPLFYEEIDLLDATKPRRITGGRGSGKTMLLRYLSHHSQFSTSRLSGDNFNFSSIGLYWRADTNFLTMFTKQGVDEENWIRLFKHYMVLEISSEVLSSIMSISKSNFSGVNSHDLNGLKFLELQDYVGDVPTDYEGVRKYIKRKIRECESAVHNPKEISNIKIFPDSFLIEGIIGAVKDGISALKESNFCVFIDEYENLLEYQQRTINTRIKHSQFPLIYHVAMKRNGMETSKTLGTESIQGIADYRNFDLDEMLSERDFDLFAAELFLSRLSPMGVLSEEHDIFDMDVLRDKNKIKERTDADYKRAIVSLVETILPGKSYSEMAVEAVSQSTHRNKLLKSINSLLKERGAGNVVADDFCREGFERALIVLPALLARKSNHPETLVEEFSKHISGEKSSFDAWIANNFVGCYLQMYRAYDRVCPFYSGFNTFVALSKGNIRHFYELCNAAMVRSDISESKLKIDTMTQVLAARAASEEILNEAPTYGRLGGKIRAFIYNLGHIFEFSHMRKTQSESEVNHFSIKGGFSSLDEIDAKFLSEAEKWGVLYQEKGTKNKDKSNPDNSDWILNPIYAPFFFISYRKKRKIDLSPEEFRILHSGDESNRLDLERFYKTKWELEDLDQPYSHTLF